MSDLATLPFIHALQQRGARVYTVGGTVRDLLLGHPRKDVDLLVTDIPQPDLIRFLRKYGHVQLTGRAFGVIKFLPRQWEAPPIDIALPRTEISTGIGHRDFVVTFDHTLPVETDLGRRDFTINAMAMDLATGHLLDPFGGRQDLAQRILRQVSAQAFPEDPLRMLRGVQLATRFALHPESTTRQAMQRHAASITTVAAERIAEELRKLLQAIAPSQGFLLMQDTGLLSHILPEIAHLVGPATIPAPLSRRIVAQDTTVGDDAFRRTVRRLDAIQQEEIITHRGHLDLLLAALFQDSGRPTAEAAAFSPIGQPERVAQIRHFIHRFDTKTAFLILDLWLADRLASTPAQATDDLLLLRQRLQEELARHVPLRLKDLAVNGRDLQRLGIPSGPHMGRILQALLQRVLDDPACNTRAYLVSVVQSELAHIASPTHRQPPEAPV
jgi:tRNA nucleotidyltransferase/poly(A) polymerase